MIKAVLVKKYPSGEASRYNWRAPCRYTAGAKDRSARPFPKNPAPPPRMLTLYYRDDLNRLLCYEEYHYEDHKGLLLVPVMFLPWLLAATALVLLRVDLSGR